MLDEFITVLSLTFTLFFLEYLLHFNSNLHSVCFLIHFSSLFPNILLSLFSLFFSSSNLTKFGWVFISHCFESNSRWIWTLTTILFVLIIFKVDSILIFMHKPMIEKILKRLHASRSSSSMDLFFTIPQKSNIPLISSTIKPKEVRKDFHKMGYKNRRTRFIRMRGHGGFKIF